MLVAIALNCSAAPTPSITSVMPKRPDFILRISIRNIEDFSPAAIVRSPRTSRPIDVQNACANLLLAVPPETPANALALARYIIFDFFALAHASGLFNRQIKTWEAFSKISAVEIRQASKGIFGQGKTSEFDLTFLDHKNRPTLLAHLAMPTEAGANYDYSKVAREFLKRASMYQGLSGIFLCYPRPFPQKVLDFIRKETNASDSISRFESIFPKLGVSVNLLEIDRSPVYNPTEKTEMQKLRLIHPDLSKKQFGNAPIPAVDLRGLDRLDPGVSEKDEATESGDSSER
jgi:hypothetical protein